MANKTGVVHTADNDANTQLQRVEGTENGKPVISVIVKPARIKVANGAQLTVDETAILATDGQEFYKITAGAYTGDYVKKADLIILITVKVHVTDADANTKLQKLDGYDGVQPVISVIKKPAPIKINNDAKLVVEEKVVLAKDGQEFYKIADGTYKDKYVKKADVFIH